MAQRPRWTCREAGDALAEHLEGGLSGQAAHLLQDHLRACPDCRETYALARRLLGPVEGGAVPDPGSDYWAGFLPRLEKRIREAETGRLSRRRVWAGISLAAAGILASAGLAAWLAFLRGGVEQLESRLDELLLAFAGTGTGEVVLEELLPGPRSVVVPADALPGGGEETWTLGESFREVVEDLSGPESAGVVETEIDLDPAGIRLLLEELKRSPEFLGGPPKG